MPEGFLRALTPLLTAFVIGCGDDAEVPAPRIPASLNFDLRLGEQSVECAGKYENIGDPGVTFTVTDARFYVHGVELLDTQGVGHPLLLDATNFQGDGIALLDFEDGCGPDGTTETNTTVTGTVSAGDFEAVRFTLGVPVESNFIDLAEASAPLDVTGMFWTWQNGYKFFKLDGSSPAREGGINPFFIHLGSAGCPGDNSQAPPSDTCSAPNRVTYEIPDFSPDQSTIVAELGDVLATSDLGFNTDGTGPGCMSELSDPECSTILPRMGASDAENQLLFHAE
jgi:uncharacterized repeat protein (TIGR04052 family)